MLESSSSWHKRSYFYIGHQAVWQIFYWAAMNVWTWNYTFFDTLLIGIKIIFVVGPHKYRRLAFPVCRAACPGGMCGMYPFVPCRFNLIWVLGCQWKSRTEKADGEWDRETAGNPPEEKSSLFVPVCLWKKKFLVNRQRTQQTRSH